MAVISNNHLPISRIDQSSAHILFNFNSEKIRMKDVIFYVSIKLILFMHFVMQTSNKLPGLVTPYKA